MLNIGKEVAALEKMTTKELRDKYAEVFGEGTPANNKPWLIKRIAWRLQAVAEGDLSARARRRAAELANDADLRMTPPKVEAVVEHTKTARIPNGDSRLPIIGSILTRKYRGETLQVKVLPQGFEFNGDVYKSLTAVARAITGTHVNGFQFFHLTKKAGVG